MHPVYPPSFGLMTWPFSLTPDVVARTLWAIVQVAALAWIGVVLLRMLRRAWPEYARRGHVLLAITALLASRYVLRDTHGGGGNLINLALVLGATDLATRGRSHVAGIVFAISLATKPTSVLFVPLFWILGFRRTASIAVAGAGGLLGLAILVHGRGLAPLETWLHGSIEYSRMANLFEAPAEGFPPFSWMNQCLRCALTRYLGSVPTAFTHLDDGAPLPGWFDGLGWSIQATLWCRHAATAIVLVFTFGLAWLNRRDRMAIPAVVAGCFAASLLLSPISWKAHHVALIPALFLLSIPVLARRTWAIALAALYLFACVAGEELVGKSFKHVQQHLYLVTLGTLVLWTLCLGRAFRPPGRIGDGLAETVR
ncbi:MAG: DUF2029 domain-containing protein [Planctomycetes bacterium]|nr:DUF2029 domain-containing protein [Planctomycetota bacterium]